MSDFPQKNFSYESDPDALLMLSFQQGDRASFENLMRKYYKRIFNFLYRMIRSREIAEDLSQDVFLRVYKSVKKYHPQAKFQTWLYTIAKNLALNELRRRKRPMVSLDSPAYLIKGEEVPKQLADERAESPLESVKREAQAQMVRNAIAQLPENQRMVVVLYRYERMSYEEIANTMGISTSAIKSLLSRARENLRKKLDRFMNE